MKNTSTANLESALALFRALPPKDKEILFQQISLERSVPQWQIDLVRKRKKDAESGLIPWVKGDDFLKSLD
jgi:hypothetical protein